MFGLGLQELLIILVIAMLFFGGKKLPEVASGLGKAVREFKRATAAPEITELEVKQVTEQPVSDAAKSQSAPQ